MNRKKGIAEKGRNRIVSKGGKEKKSFFFNGHKIPLSAYKAILGGRKTSPCRRRRRSNCRANRMPRILPEKGLLGGGRMKRK